MGNNACNYSHIRSTTCTIKEICLGSIKRSNGQRERDINKDIDDAEQAKVNAQNLKKKIERHLKRLKMKFKNLRRC